MGWATFRAWLAQMQSDRRRDARSDVTPAESWSGARHDSFWARSG